MWTQKTHKDNTGYSFALVHGYSLYRARAITYRRYSRALSTTCILQHSRSILLRTPIPLADIWVEQVNLNSAGRLQLPRIESCVISFYARGYLPLVYIAATSCRY